MLFFPFRMVLQHGMFQNAQLMVDINQFSVLDHQLVIVGVFMKILVRIYQEHQ